MYNMHKISSGKHVYRSWLDVNLANFICTHDKKELIMP